MIEDPYILTTPSMIITVQVWWAQTWRAILWLIPVIIGIFLFSAVIGFGVALSHGNIEAIKGSLTLLGMFFGFCGGVFAYHKAIQGTLGKNYSGYKLVFVKADLLDEKKDPGFGA